MTPYLILHKVYGKPAFDVAHQIECAHCHNANSCGDYEGPTCDECDGLGYWWITSTYGHRAYPYWHTEIEFDGKMLYINGACIDHAIINALDVAPEHFTTQLAPKEKPKESLLAKLGLSAPKPYVGELKRRI